MKRSNKVRSYQGYWGVVAGYLEKEDSKPLERALLEVAEETRITTLELIKEGKPFELVDEELQIKWVVHPFLFKVNTDKVKIDWEHTEFKWIKPEEISKYKTPPFLKDVMESILE